ncbi:MAG: alpha-hydroxy acid oxidase [Alphaproteobacteria bacterium]|nr:alpha-hydroxy acid oxidase [Alphaproteobacteria bacterium]
MKNIFNIEDLKNKAQKRVPKMFYEYADSGSWNQETYFANQKDFGKIKFRQRVGIDIEERSLSKKFMGQKVSIPVALAPTGLCGMQHRDGEILAAQASEEFGVPFTLSTMSICSIEDVAENTTKPFWFQLYVMKDKKFMSQLLERAQNAGCKVLQITMDLNILGQRHVDVRNGLSAPPKFQLSHIQQIISRPRWALGMLRAKRHFFGNVVGHAEGVTDSGALWSWIGEQFDARFSWDDLDWLRNQWNGKIILKGILDADDAEIAARLGYDGIVVSNHGGRQLDGAISSISALPNIVDKVGKKMEVYMDGGIRSGQDVCKALCMGAQGVLIGRSFLYGLGAYGKKGVTKCLEIMRESLDESLGFLGENNVQDLGRNNILYKSYNEGFLD